MPGASRLAIAGEVERPLSLSPGDLAGLADGDLLADFHCREGWSRLGQRWRGVRLATLLELAGVRDSARHVTIASGDYTVVLDRARAEDERVLLALERDGRALRPEDGLPRLVGPSEWDCFLSVKSVELIEATAEPAPATAETIALARIGLR